jgi:hypothetical protein
MTCAHCGREIGAQLFGVFGHDEDLCSVTCLWAWERERLAAHDSTATDATRNSPFVSVTAR